MIEVARLAKGVLALAPIATNAQPSLIHRKGIAAAARISADHEPHHTLKRRLGFAVPLGFAIPPRHAGSGAIPLR